MKAVAVCFLILSVALCNNGIDSCLDHLRKISEAEIVQPTSVYPNDIPKYIEKIKNAINLLSQLGKQCTTLTGYLNNIRDYQIQVEQINVKRNISKSIRAEVELLEKIKSQKTVEKKAELLFQAIRDINNAIFTLSENFAKINFLAFWEVSTEDCTNRVLKGFQNIDNVNDYMVYFQDSLVTFKYCYSRGRTAAKEGRKERLNKIISAQKKNVYLPNE
eukprot:TRINITY_DN709_c0_g1_i1.p2 TRINITY_DN709_c0_g1~~TRINITY_DN709_c0_g1_i1.p2  ORF type:complete len:218 (+),score=79.02 TRINITY_DN709_c0_g1_i1:165-818(+)